MLGNIQDSLLSLIFPQSCHICSGHVERHFDGIACATCWNSTRQFDHTEMLCEKCGAYFGDEAAPHPVFCHRCTEHHYVKARALGIYEHALAAVVIELKHRPNIPHRLLVNIDKFVATSDIFCADIIVPVPLAAQRHLERGFNQAETIARVISKASRLPFDTFSLKREVHTPLHRGGMDQKARELTVKKAFEVVRPKFFEGKRILLVDDVLTSGSTASACAKALLRSGAVKVNVFTLARAAFRRSL